ncbi:spore maturation protein [Anopheles sinensis]|uniref:Spore maturation protein n=1 Tax=Anopheles sinensis TaxID=74873 RepID=A0A084VE84_ANOSI|nr:spore maturation protein [Anopheles sinensis]
MAFHSAPARTMTTTRQHADVPVTIFEFFHPTVGTGSAKRGKLHEHFNLHADLWTRRTEASHGPVSRKCPEKGRNRTVRRLKTGTPGLDIMAAAEQIINEKYCIHKNFISNYVIRIPVWSCPFGVWSASASFFLVPG